MIKYGMSKRIALTKEDQKRIDKLEFLLNEMILMLDQPSNLKNFEKRVENWLIRAKITINEQ